MKTVREDKYYQYYLILEEGENPFHEWIHYLHNVGTTFGAVQLIGYHIQSKAMNMIFRRLGKKKMLRLPLSIEYLEEIYEELEDRTKKLVQILKDYEGFEAKHVGSISPVPIDKKLDDYGWYVGNPKIGPPILKISNSYGIELKFNLISELHNYIIAKLQDEDPDLYLERYVIKRIDDTIGSKWFKLIALLCDWSLMTPYREWMGMEIGENNPGWRFIWGLEFISNISDNKKEKYTNNYFLFSRDLSESLNFHDLDKLNEIFIKYSKLTGKKSNSEDAKRNKKFYEFVTKILKAAYNIRKDSPTAIAFPHLNLPKLKKELKPLVIKKGNELKSDYESMGWFLTYISVISQGRQAFDVNSTRIECAYYYFGIDHKKHCKAFRKSEKNEDCCYKFPLDYNDSKWIDCVYLDLHRSLRLKLKEH